jgi:nicotinate-nucleotide adenylyltransferase
MAMRLGILGGTFDPIHFGHLLLAETCREQLHLERVWFLPAAVPPHKQRLELVPGPQRIEMIGLAIGGHEALAVCSYEVDRGGVNYTVDTLAHLKEEDSARELFFLMGADSLGDLPSWKEPGRLCRLAVPVVVARTARGSSNVDEAAPNLDVLSNLVDGERLETIRRHQVSMPQIELSSSDIRSRVARGQSIRYRTPRAVEKYIEAHGLYRSEAPRPATPR